MHVWMFVNLDFRFLFEAAYLTGVACGLLLALGILHFWEANMKNLMIGAAIGFSAAILLVLFGVSMTFE